MTVVDDDLERVVARLWEGDTVQPHHDVRLDGPAGLAARDLQWALGFEQLAAVVIDEADLQTMGTLLGEVGAHAQDEDHARVTEGEYSCPNGIEDPEYVELTFLADIGRVRDDGEVYVHDFGRVLRETKTLTDRRCWGARCFSVRGRRSDAGAVGRDFGWGRSGAEWAQSDAGLARNVAGAARSDAGAVRSDAEAARTGSTCGDGGSQHQDVDRRSRDSTVRRGLCVAKRSGSAHDHRG